MILVLDNYDSFTYNLVQFLGELGAEMKVARNNKISIDEIEKLQPSAIVISPGPCTPNDAGITLGAIQHFHKTVPILGVCLGHQSIGQAFGGNVVKAPSVVHGKTAVIEHSGTGIFRDVPNKFIATRYHSLVVSKENFPEKLDITAWTRDGVIMGIQHKEFPTFGVQFHPESIATQFGKTILENFLKKQF
ncbi:MAG: aminodeoxychorismate/anthranilate synthase component II [Bacteroidota bacterium]|nr:aminodeoxychorismate/anthranilate synthase component II [Bacteroidota bacterium]